ncbi:MAG: ABC transporter permease subunit [Micropepsaceae bacterium]
MTIPMSQDDKYEAMKAAQAVKGRSLWQDARRRLFRNKAAVVSMIILSIIVALAIFAPYLSRHAYDAQDYQQISCPPSWTIDMALAVPPADAAPDSPQYKAYEEYSSKYPQTALCGQGIVASHQFALDDWKNWCADPSVTTPPDVNCAREPQLDDFKHFMGTDGVGRDLWVRTLYGARVSLSVGVVATVVALIIGVLYGATAGYAGGRVDNYMMRFVDIMYALPFIFFVIILMTVTADIPFFKDPFNRFILIFAAIGAVEWLTMARIVRGQTLSIRRKEFVEAAVAAGVPTGKIIMRHIIPNVVGPVIVFVTLTIPAIILAESFLSFLGLGVQEPMTSWGVLMSEGAGDMENKPWLLIVPALMMAVTLFCFNFIGDGLRDALDPKDR